MLTAGFSQVDGGDFDEVRVGPPTSRLAIFALILGLLSMFVCCVPYFGAAVGGVALILGGIAVFTIASSQGTRKGSGLAVTGIVFGIIGAVLGMGATFGFKVAGQYLADAGSIPAALQDGESLSSMRWAGPELTTGASEESIDSFIAAITEKYGDLEPPPASVLGYFGTFEGLSEADMNGAMDAAKAAGYSSGPMPVALKGEKGTALFILPVDNANGTIRNIGVWLDGDLVWLVEPE